MLVVAAQGVGCGTFMSSVEQHRHSEQSLGSVQNSRNVREGTQTRITATVEGGEVRGTAVREDLAFEVWKTTTRTSFVAERPGMRTWILGEALLAGASAGVGGLFAAHVVEFQDKGSEDAGPILLAAGGVFATAALVDLVVMLATTGERAQDRVAEHRKKASIDTPLAHHQFRLPILNVPVETDPAGRFKVRLRDISVPELRLALRKTRAPDPPASVDVDVGQLREALRAEIDRRRDELVAEACRKIGAQQGVPERYRALHVTESHLAVFKEPDETASSRRVQFERRVASLCIGIKWVLLDNKPPLRLGEISYARRRDVQTPQEVVSDWLARATQHVQAGGLEAAVDDLRAADAVLGADVTTSPARTKVNTAVGAALMNAAINARKRREHERATALLNLAAGLDPAPTGFAQERSALRVERASSLLVRAKTAKKRGADDEALTLLREADDILDGRDNALRATIAGEITRIHKQWEQRSLKEIQHARRRGHFSRARELLIKAGEGAEYDRETARLEAAIEHATPSRTRQLARATMQNLVTNWRLAASSTSYGDEAALYSHAAGIRYAEGRDALCSSDKGRLYLAVVLSRYFRGVSGGLDAIAGGMDAVDAARSQRDQVLAAERYNVAMSTFKAEYGRPERFVDEHGKHCSGVHGTANILRRCRQPMLGTDIRSIDIDRWCSPPE